MRLLPYRMSSGTARLLAERLNLLRIRMPGTRFRPRSGDLIINWGYDGANGLPGRYHMGTVRWLNHPAYIANARDKLNTFRKLQGVVPTVNWTTDKDVAIGWLQRRGVFVRQTTRGQGGAGIIYVDPSMPDTHVLPDAPLYTERFNAQHECRVHVVRGQVLAQKKRRRTGTDPHPVRNHANGYVYCTGNFECPTVVIARAKAAISA